MAGTAEVSTSNLRSGASFDNLKATWGKALNIGDELSLGYEVTKNFGGDKTTEVKLTAEVSGSTITAELDSVDNLKEVSATRSVTIGDRDIDLEPSFLVKA